MASKGIAGPRAANYLQQTLGVSRSLAYALLNGSKSIDEDQVKVLTPLLGEDALSRIQDARRRRLLAEAEAIVSAHGDAGLAKRIARFAKAKFEDIVVG